MTSHASVISMKLALDAAYKAIERKNDLRSASTASKEGVPEVNGALLGESLNTSFTPFEDFDGPVELTNL